MFILEGKRLNGNEFKIKYNDDNYKVAKFEYECVCTVAEYAMLREVKNDRSKQLYLYHK